MNAYKHLTERRFSIAFLRGSLIVIVTILSMLIYSASQETAVRLLKKLFPSKKIAPYGKRLHFINGVNDNVVTMGKNPDLKGDNVIDFWRDSSKNTITIGENFICNDFKIVFKGHSNTLIIEDNVRWTGHILIVGTGRTVRIGQHTTARGVYILSRSGDVTIGEHCLFSREIEIRTTDVHKVYDIDSKKRINVPGSVTVADNVWVAARAMLSKGASIPRHCVVGANSFVNKAFTEENVIIAGTPAKIVKRNIYWKR